MLCPCTCPFATKRQTASHKRTNPASEVAPKLTVINGIKQEKNREDILGAACASANQPTVAKQNNQAVHCKETLTSAKKDPPSLTLKRIQEGNGRKNTGPQGEVPTPQITVISDDTLGPTIWLTLRHVDTDDPKSKLTLLQEHKSNILDKKGWLFDTEIQAGQILRKKQFPLIDNLHDPSVKGHLVKPASTEFVQIVNVGEHWLCLTSIGVPCLGVVRVFDSLYRKPNATAAERACRILLHTGDH